MSSDRDRPLKPIDFLILIALEPQDRHGYGVLLDVEVLSGGTVRLDPGNLYRSLRGLMRRGFVERLDRRPAPESEDERRRYYRLSADGRRVAADEAHRMNELLRLAPVRRLIAEPTS